MGSIGASIPKKMIPNILKADLDWAGQDVYVVGPGPNAAPYMLGTDNPPLELPPDAPIIACNKGIFCRRMPTVWLCATPLLAKAEWFNELMRKYNIMSPEIPMVVGRLGEWLDNYPFTHYFNCGSSLWSDAKRDPRTNKLTGVYKRFGCINGYLRGGASAVARGMQLAWFKEAKRCILIGADMRGRGYFDGTINEHKSRTLDKEGNWLELTYFNELIKWVKARDMDVVSLTKTELDVEVIDDVRES